RLALAAHRDAVVAGVRRADDLAFNVRKAPAEQVDVAVERTQRLTDVAVVAALDRVHGADQAAVGIDHGAATQRGGHRVHGPEHLSAGHGIGTAGPDPASR